MRSIILDPAILSQLAGKTAIITGSANGIGAQTASLFNSHGANVVIADLEPTRVAAEALVATFLSPLNAIFIPTNILNWAEMKSLFSQTKERFGSVEIVIANGGIMEPKSVLDMDDLDDNGDLVESKEAFKVIDVNLKGTLNSRRPFSTLDKASLTITPPIALRLALFSMKSNPPCFQDNSRGSIVLLASTSGYFGGTGVAAYVASKHGTIGLLRAAQGASQNAGIRLNAVAPFFTPTQITAGFAEEWKSAGLENNTVEGVGLVIAHMALDCDEHGACALVNITYVHMLRKLF
jgi:NAD(P)-dependent dehydrogenase (short-subunit alcohol dehydrogenase family)